MTQQIENRETFLNRFRPVLPPSEFLKIEIGYALAKHAHRSQVRKELDEMGRPVRYFEHLRSTSLVAVDELGIIEMPIATACLMHDSLEDTKDIHPQMLEFLFGPEVALMVQLLTKAPKEGYYDRLAKHGGWKTLMVKGCDRLSNLRTLEGCPEEFQLRQRKETKEKIYPLMDLMVVRAPAEYKVSANKLRSLIWNNT